MIIQLDDLPDCASCPDLTKRVKGRAIDLDGPKERSNRHEERKRTD